MTQTQLETQLMAVGASHVEASDLAGIIYEDFFRMPTAKSSKDFIKALQIRLNVWRVERNEIALSVRQQRIRTDNAGYRALPLSVPVFIGCGRTEW
jgi:hypothetical protein